MSKLAVFSFVAFVVSALITVAVCKVALRFGIVARRDSRRRHERPTPLLGGTGVYAVVSLFFGFAIFYPETIGISEGSGTHLPTLWLAVSLIYFLGAVDDILELSAAPKFLIQLLAAGLVVYGSPEISEFFSKAVGGPHWLSAIFLLVWCVGITNATNMIDGLDGLCAGVSALSAVTIGLIMLYQHPGDPQASQWIALSFTLAGALGGFLLLNFFPARIFLGDSGSLLLGFLLAVISAQLEVKRSLLVSLSLPVILLGIPVLDASLSIIRRTRQKRSWFQGDRGHLHHRLQQLGLNHRSAVLFLWCVAGYLNWFAFMLSQIPSSLSATIYIAFAPVPAVALIALRFVEARLSLQGAQFARLLLRRQEAAFDSVAELKREFEERTELRLGIERPRGGCVFIHIDCGVFINQLNSRSAGQIAGFYLQFLNSIGAVMRPQDKVARLFEHQVMILLTSSDPHPSELDRTILDLQRRLKFLQDQYSIFRNNNELPAGFQVLRLPEGSAQITRLFRSSESSLPESTQSNTKSGIA